MDVSAKHFMRMSTGVHRRPVVKLAVLDVVERREPRLETAEEADRNLCSRDGGCHVTPCYKSTVIDSLWPIKRSNKFVQYSG